jgi:hypothetical protein
MKPDWLDAIFFSRRFVKRWMIMSSGSNWPWLIKVANYRAPTIITTLSWLVTETNFFEIAEADMINDRESPLYKLLVYVSRSCAP